MSPSGLHKTRRNHLERQGNVWSGVVALVLLGMLTVALVASEMNGNTASPAAPAATYVIAGQ